MRYINNYYSLSLFAIFTVSLFANTLNLTKYAEINLAHLSIASSILAMAFSLYFSRSKLFTLLFIPLFFTLYMYYPTFLNLDGGFYSFWYTYPIVVSIGFLCISLLDERGITSYYGISKVLIISILLLVTYFIIRDFSIDTRSAIDTKLFTFDLPSIIKLSDFTLLLTLLTTFFTSLIAFFYSQTQSDRAIPVIFFTLIVPALFFPTNVHFTLLSILSSLLVIFALLKDTYKMAYIDTLTNIPARRALEEEFLRLGSKFTVAMIDIDFFKKFNDTYGHDIGDEVLKLVAIEISKVKGGGKAYRYGGEEFTILFPNKTSDESLLFLEEVRENIAKRGFVIRDKNRPDEKPKIKSKQTNNKKVNLSVSIGIANASKSSKDPYSVMKNADNSLYKAKENGRNCSVIFYK